MQSFFAICPIGFLPAAVLYKSSDRGRVSALSTRGGLLPSVFRRWLVVPLFVLGLLFAQSLWSQNYFPVEHITPKDGLSYREVNAIYQDSLGFLWIATAKGLNCYDGVEWVLYRQSDGDSMSVPNNSIQWVMEEGTGNLLLGLAGGHICFFDRHTGAMRLARWLYRGKFAKFMALQPFLTPAGDYQVPVLALETKETFLLRYLGNGQFGQAVSIEGPTDIEFYSSYTYPTRFLGGAANRYWYWKAGIYSCFQLFDYTYNTYSPISSAYGQFMFPVLQPTNGQLLDSFELPGHMSVTDFANFTFDNHWNVWLRGKNNRVYKYDVRQRRMAEKGEFDFDSSPLEYKIFEDREGTVWIPHKFGIAKIKKRRRYFENYLNAPEQWEAMPQNGQEVYAMAEDKTGNVLIAAKGFFLLNPKTKSTGPVAWKYSAAPQGALPSPPDAYWPFTDLKMLSRSDSSLWMNMGYLVNYNPEDNTYRFFDYAKAHKLTSIRHTLAEDNRGRLWLSKGKLLSFNQATGDFWYDSRWQQYEITNLLRADGDYLWATTKSGLIRFHMQTHTVEAFNLFSENHLKDPVLVFTILPYKGFIWIGTYENYGLLKFNPETRQLTRYTTADGLSHNIIYTILPDGDNLWMGTHNGLCKFNINTGAVRNYYVEDGLTHNEFNREAAVKTRDGKMYFGGMNGINAFYPAALDSLSKAESSALVWTRFGKIDGKTDTILSYSTYQLSTASSIQLGYQDRSFTFHYALLCFAEPSENKYYHYLEGFDKTWNYAGNVSFVNYPSLPPGKYTLRIKANDAHGNPGLNELAIPIVVYGPWWNTWWAWCLFAILLTALFLGIRQYEMRRLLAQSEARRLKELDSAKSRLYTNITHEFRTPLTVIMGITDNIPGAEQERQLIRRNSQKLLHLINQMLDLSKVETGAMKLNLHQADIINYLRYLTESFYSMAEEKAIRLVFYSEEPELVMDFDEQKLQHIVYNLLSNALKFTPSDSGGKVVLHVHKIQQNDQNWLQLKVQDTGMGISKENLPYIFDRFYQVDDSHTRSGEGTGIGLALTKEFIELLGGSISISSTPGKGSTFTILLPVKNEAPLASATEMEVAVDQLLPEIDMPAEVTNIGLARFNKQLAADKPLLLLVEDNKDVAAYIRSILKEDYRIQTALHGKAGLEMAIELTPDIIISDVMMPEMDGYQLAQTLKTDERTSHIPIILLTAKAGEHDRLTGLRTGADAYLIKPFNKAELLVRVEKLTELRRELQLRYSGLHLSPANTLPANPEDAFLQKLIQIVEAQLDNPEFTTTGLCQEALLSQSQLYRKLMALTGKSPTLFIRTIRLRKAAELLQTTDLNISEIAWATGFNDPNYFSRVFHEEFGKTPKEWRS